MKGDIDGFCRKRVPAYWMHYFLPKDRSRLWMLFCYCFRKMDDLLDGRTNARKRIDRVVSSALSGRRLIPNSNFEEALCKLIHICRRDKRLLKVASDAYAGEMRDVRGGRLSGKRQLESAILGKSIAFTKMWIGIIEPGLDERTADYLSLRLGRCGQTLDDVNDIREDFAAGRVNIPKERLPKGELTLEKVIESGYWREECARAERLHYEALEKIRRIRAPFRSRVLLLALALYLDPKHRLAGEPARAKHLGGNNTLRKLSVSLSRVYPKNYAVGSAIASAIGLPILVLLLAIKGYSKFLPI